MCFVFRIFLKALDVNATKLIKTCKLRAYVLLLHLPKLETSEAVMAAYGAPLSLVENIFYQNLFDPRLLMHIAPAVAEAAMRTGVAHKN